MRESNPEGFYGTIGFVSLFAAGALGDSCFIATSLTVDTKLAGYTSPLLAFF